MTLCLFCFVPLVHISECKVPFFFFSALRGDLFAYLKWRQMRCHYCFPNLYKDMLQKFNVKDEYIFCQLMCFYFFWIYILSSFASFIYNLVILEKKCQFLFCWIYISKIIFPLLEPSFSHNMVYSFLLLK